MFEAKLIALYFYICERYGKELKYQCTRFSNNASPVFADLQALTIYFYTVSEERRFKVREIHEFAQRDLSNRFPKLPSYQAFYSRLNRLVSAVQSLSLNIFLNLDSL